MTAADRHEWRVSGGDLRYCPKCGSFDGDERSQKPCEPLAASGRPTNPLWVGRSQDGVHFEQTFDGEPAAAEISRSPASYGWRLWRGWNVWTKTECDRCGSRYKVTSGKPRNVVRQWIVVRFGR